jgi:hypothetical protein
MGCAAACLNQPLDLTPWPRLSGGAPDNAARAGRNAAWLGKLGFHYNAFASFSAPQRGWLIALHGKPLKLDAAECCPFVGEFQPTRPVIRPAHEKRSLGALLGSLLIFARAAHALPPPHNDDACASSGAGQINQIAPVDNRTYFCLALWTTRLRLYGPRKKMSDISRGGRLLVGIPTSITATIKANESPAISQVHHRGTRFTRLSTPSPLVLLRCIASCVRKGGV